MSKIRMAVVVAAMALLAVGCGSSRDSSATKQVKASSGASVAAERTADGIGHPTPALCHGKQYRVGYDQFSGTQPFAVQVVQGIRAAVKKVGCIKLTVLDDNADPATAASNINTLVRERMNGIMMFQIVESASAGLMRSIKAAKIPALAYDVVAPGAPLMTYNGPASGTIAGDKLAAAQLKKDPKAKPYVVLGVDPESGPVEEEAMDNVEKAIKAKIPGIPASHWILLNTKVDPTVAFTATNDVVSKIPKDAPILLSGENDEVIAAMFRALVQHGLQKNILAMGVADLYPIGPTYVCKYPHQYLGTVSYQPLTAGNYLIPEILAEMQGKKVPPTVVTPDVFIDKAKAHQLYPQLAACR